MKIKIREDALEVYIKDHTDWEGNYFGEDTWEIILSKIAGRELEVDTEMLFKHEYNIKPIPGVTKSQIRVLDEYVSNIEDDVRNGKMKCDFCNTVSESMSSCPGCGRSDYLELLIEED